MSSSEDQRRLIATKSNIPLKSTDSAVPAIFVGSDPLYPSGSQFLLQNKQVVTRKVTGPELRAIPFGFIPKPAQAIPLIAPPAITFVPQPPTIPTVSTQQSVLPTTAPLPSNNQSLPTRSLNVDSITKYGDLDTVNLATLKLPELRTWINSKGEQWTSTGNTNSIRKEARELLDNLLLERSANHPIHIQQAPLSPNNQPLPTRSSSSLRSLICSFICLAALPLALSTTQNAVQRKASIKAEIMKSASTYFQSIKPEGISNKLHSEPVLTPPVHSFDEFPLTRALAMANHPSAPQELKTSIDAAVANEMHRVMITFDTLRVIDSTNPMEKDATRVHSLMFIKFKRDGRVTARLAGCGNEQPEDTFDDISASTSDHPTWIATLAAYYAEAIKTGTLDTLVHFDFDITGAFLQERLPRSATGGKQLLVKLPSALPHPLAGQWCEAVGALYGLKQANHIFEVGFAKTMAAIDFYPPAMPNDPSHSATDPSVYNYSDPTDSSKHATINMHVDDGNGFANDPTIVLRLKTHLESRYGAITWNQESKGHTGTNITRHPSGAVSLDLQAHILKMLTKVGMSTIPGALTPSSPDLFYPATDTTPTPIRPYQRLVGDLTHISRIRYDIVKESRQHSKQSSHPTNGDLLRVIRTLRYLKAFPETPANYYTTDGAIMTASVDTAFANQPDGTLKTCISLSIGPDSAPFLFKVLPQSEPAVDPFSSEYFGYFIICKFILRYRYYLESIGFPQTDPTIIYVDNVPAIDLANATSIPRKSRYIHARYHFVRYLQKNKTIEFRPRNTNLHGPDLGTKSPGPTQFHHLARIVMNLDAPLTAP